MGFFDKQEISKKGDAPESSVSPGSHASELRHPGAPEVQAGRVGATNQAQKTLDTQFGDAPVIADRKGDETFERLSFERTQKIQQRPNESSEDLHERLRPTVVNGFESVRQPTEIDTPSWYTFDASKTLGIKDAVAIVTSTCKHELPYRVIVGIRSADWDQPGRLPSGEEGHRYRLRDLGRELTEQEKNAIYDRM
jgi:hypothetical protein